MIKFIQNIPYNVMKSCVLVMIAAFITSGCKTLPEPDFSPDQPHIKVVTYNVNWGFVNPQKVVDFIDKADAGVVCLQETHSRWEAALKGRLKERYPYCVFKERQAAGGIAIMSKYKLKNVTLIEPTEGWFPALLADVQTPIGQIQFLNVHLKPPLSDRGSVTVSAYYETKDIHLKEIKYFLDKTDLNKPLIIAGDFNENEKAGTVRWLIEQGFSDALSSYDAYSKTWRWETSYGITIDNRYDHIIISKHLDCTGAKVTKIEASDHMPVLVVIVQRKSDKVTPQTHTFNPQGKEKL